MNYMEKVANMLGVEIGQYFEIGGLYGTYFLANSGLYHVESGYEVEKTLSDLLSGKCKIKHKPWKPKYGEHYYCVGSTGNAHREQWYGDVLDILYYKVGNCYKTYEEAKANLDKWTAFYASDEVFEV